jgi:hypothetical protein
MSFGVGDDDFGFFSVFEAGYRKAGIHPAWIHAFRETRIVPLKDCGFRSEQERRTWQDAVEGYMRDHPDAGPPDHPDELAKWRADQALPPLEMAAMDVDFGPSVIEWLRQPEDNHRNRGLAGFLLDTREELLAEFRADDALRHSALALAKRWGGPELVREVEGCRDATAPVSLVGLAVVTVARLRAKPA